MSDVTETIPQDSPEQGGKKSDGKIRAADGTSLKRSLNRALRRQKLRALILIAPLLIFVLVTFIAPIADMLFRSVENQIVAQTLPRTTEALADWEAGSGQAPGAPVYKALYEDIFIAQERKLHTRLGSRLNYELTGASSLFRKSGRGVGDMGEVYQDQFEDFDDFWKKGENWNAFLGSDEWLAEIQAWGKASGDDQPAFEMRDGMEELFPQTAAKYEIFADFVQYEDGDNLYKEDPWALIYSSFYDDLTGPTAPQIAAYGGPAAAQIKAAAAAAAGFETVDYAAAFAEIDKDWAETPIWETIQTYSGPFTNGYFLNAVDMQKSPDGAELRPENQRIYGTLFLRTLFMSLMITGSCILLGYPVAWLLANLPARTANLLMILVLLPFMILPLYSVMATIPPAFLRAAKSLGATNWTAFWRVYFPQSVPGIGAGSILVFILSIGYYITPEIVGGTTGTFISNRIAYHISSSLNWGLAAALGAILLAVVLALYWAYDKIVGIDNVKLGG